MIGCPFSWPLVYDGPPLLGPLPREVELKSTFERRAPVVSFSRAELLDALQQLDAFYAAHRDEYRAPERVTFWPVTASI